MDMAQSSEAETSGGVSSEIDYDVFLSFRGPDTRQGFTNCLYNHLRQENIHVFLDEEELHVGKEIADELPAAIEKSKIYIPIFSKNYAGSAWCLRELAHMVECKNSCPSEKEIMPIFFDVETDDVKLKSPSTKENELKSLPTKKQKLNSQPYVDALEQHEKKYDHETRKKWEDALRSVGQIKGWELKNQGYWEFSRSVTREIVMKLKTKDKLVTEYLVGADTRVKDIEKLLDVNSQGMRVVLIHGMGGVGKTTLAKIVFNRLNSHFHHCCFLQDVRETSLKSHEILQERLLSNMFGPSFCKKFNDVDDGIKEIKHLLSRKKVFIILDDVSDKEQIKNLAIEHISFGSGSRLIMTSRDQSLDVLPNHTEKYEVETLDRIQSFELFSRHAFKSNLPQHDYVSLSKEVVLTTGGLPLALEVIGSFLHGQEKDIWIDVIQRLAKAPDKQVEETLKISYNALIYEERQIFLDIACLFLNEDSTNAFYMWEDCDYQPRYSIDVLVCRSLVKIIDDNKLWMHDQLRDLGRKIVRGEPMHPRKQSRLWDDGMAERIIRTKEEKEAIEAICLVGSASKSYTGEEFSRLPHLRYLKICWKGQLAGDFEDRLSKLRYMSWRCCPKEFLPTNFHPSNLVVLDLSRGNNNEDWDGWSQIKAAKKLKVLNLSYNQKITKTPDFSDHTSLERLILEGCHSLIEVDDSIEKLKCLGYFNANGCTSLGELPEGIGGLKKLNYLYLGGCKKLRKLPESLGRMASLVELDLSESAITKLPNSIGHLKHLLVLNVRLSEIDELPSSIGNLQKLKVINIANSPMRDLPQSIVELKELEELRAENCPHLEWEIPEGIWKLSHLRVLHLDYTPITNVPVTIKQLPRLEILGLDGCSKLELLPELPTSLITLSFGSSSLRWVPNLSSLTLLKTLTYSGHDEKRCPLFYQDGPCRESHGFLPPSLSKMDVSYNKISTSFSVRGNFRNLTDLSISFCSWKEIQLDGLEQLVELCVINLELLEEFAGLSGLKRLTQLTLWECPNLTTIQGLGSVESLITLKILGCGKIESLKVSGLKKLEELSISFCEELVTVEGLDELESLENLEFESCKSLTSFPIAINSKIPDTCHLSVDPSPNFEGNCGGAHFNGSVGEYRSRY